MKLSHEDYDWMYGVQPEHEPVTLWTLLYNFFFPKDDKLRAYDDRPE